MPTKLEDELFEESWDDAIASPLKAYKEELNILKKNAKEVMETGVPVIMAKQKPQCKQSKYKLDQDEYYSFRCPECNAYAFSSQTPGLKCSGGFGAEWHEDSAMRYVGKVKMNNGAKQPNEVSKPVQPINIEITIAPETISATSDGVEIKTKKQKQS